MSTPLEGLSANEVRGWRDCKLGDVLELKRGYDLPQQCREPGTVPVVSSSGPSGLHSEAKVRAPGVVTGRYGTIGKVFYIANDFWPLNTTLYVRDFKGSDPKFIAYFLETIDFHSCSDKAAVPGVNRNHLHELPVRVPPIDEQRAIAHIRGALDDKIDLNRRMNETLEAMARALFKSWFVDFDPVRAKAQGQAPAGMDAATAALFPSEFQDSELGEIPKGWTVGRLDDLLVLQRGFDLPKKDRLPGPYALVTTSGITDRVAEAKVRGPGVVTGRSGQLGITTFVPGDYWPLNTTLWIKEFRRSRPHHAYFLLTTLGLQQFNAGSAVPTLNRNHVHGMPLVVPSEACVARFEDLARPLFGKKQANERENERLENVRDSLLPRLLSGELSVVQAQLVVETTV